MAMGTFNPYSAQARLAPSNISGLMNGASNALSSGINGLSKSFDPFIKKKQEAQQQEDLLARDTIRRENRLVDELNTFERGVEVKDAKNDGISQLMTQFNGTTDKKAREAIKAEIIASGGSASLINGLGGKSKTIHKTFIDDKGNLTAIFSDGTSKLLEGNYGSAKTTKVDKKGGFTGDAGKFFTNRSRKEQDIMTKLRDFDSSFNIQPVYKDGKKTGANKIMFRGNSYNSLSEVEKLMKFAKEEQPNLDNYKYGSDGVAYLRDGTTRNRPN